MKDNVYIFDLDDTVCLTDPTVFELAYMFYNLRVTDEYRLSREHHDLVKMGWLESREQEEKIIKAIKTFQLYRHLPLMDGVIDWFWQHPFEQVIFVTNRPCEVRDQTEYWLKNCGIQARDPMLLMKNDKEGRGKKENLQFLLDGVLKDYDMGNVYYIENDPRHVKAALELDFKNIVTFDYSYNREYEFQKSGVTILPNPELEGFKWKI